MRYSQLIKTLSRSGVVESIRSYGQLIEKLEDGKVLINGIETEFSLVEEARQYIKQDYISHQLAEQVSTETYEDLSNEKLANIIREHYNTKITDTLIESYIELASSNMFTVDPVVTAIKESKTSEFSGKLQYELNDGSVVAINEATQEMLNNILKDKPEIVEYMRESKNNFMRIIKELEE